MQPTIILLFNTLLHLDLPIARQLASFIESGLVFFVKTLYCYPHLTLDPIITIIAH